MRKEYAIMTLGGVAILVLAIATTIHFFKSSEDRSAASYVRIVRGAEIASRVGYEVVIAELAMGSPQNPVRVSRRMNVDGSRAAELILEFQAFIEERTRNQWGYLRDTCNRRDSIQTVDQIVEESRERLRRNDQGVDQQLALLLSRLTPGEAEQLMYLAEEARANSTSAEVDPGDYYRARGAIDVQEELTQLCSRLAP